VDFYAERRQRLLVSRYRGQDYTLEKPDLAWLGSDADGSDGWSVSLPVREALDGDDWTVRAVAYDDQGLSTSVRSTGTFTIVGRNRPVMRLLSPSADRALYGLTTVDVRAIAGAQYLRQADVYVESLDGVLGYLGQMTRTVTSRGIPERSPMVATGWWWLALIRMGADRCCAAPSSSCRTSVLRTTWFSPMSVKC